MFAAKTSRFETIPQQQIEKLPQVNGCARLLPTMRQAKVAMISPDLTFPDRSPHSYLSTVSALLKDSN
jgi:hypothetical protein